MRHNAPLRPLAHRMLSGVLLLITLVCWLMVTPLVALVIESLADIVSNPQETSLFSDMAGTVLGTYTQNSVLVVLGTLLFSALFAIPTAWWCARYEFWGRRVIQWAMIFPLAIPAYISAYVYTDVLDYAGPLQSWVRAHIESSVWQSYLAIDIRTLSGGAWVLALSLYPYLFLLLKNAFERQPSTLQDAAKLLGHAPTKLFFRVHLPLARPAIAIGCTLIAMETLADYGTMNLFAISTLTTAIYDSWLVHGSLPTAAKLSCLLLLFIILASAGEQYSRRKAAHYGQGDIHPHRPRLSRPKQALVLACCLSLLTLAFLFPVAQLVHYASLYLEFHQWHELWAYAKITFLMALLAAIITLAIAIVLNVRRRFSHKRAPKVLQAVTSTGYAIPGTILAIGILIPLGAADNALNQLTEWLFGSTVGLIFSGTSFAMVSAFVIRFAAIANGTLHSSYQAIAPNLDHAARALGADQVRLLGRVHRPLMTPALISAVLIVFVECVKELPASLLLRPFDFETLATYVYQYAADEQLERVSMAALSIIAISLIPILLLIKTQKHHD